MAYVQHTFEPNEVLTSGSMNNLVEGINERLTKREYDVQKIKGYDLLFNDLILEPTENKYWSFEDGYYLTTEEPLDWDISYSSYFTKNEIDEYIPVPEVTEGADIPEWERNTYYGSVSEYKTIILHISSPLTATSECPDFITEYSYGSDAEEIYNYTTIETPHNTGSVNADTWSKCENDHGFLRVESIDWYVQNPTSETVRDLSLKTAYEPKFTKTTDWVRTVSIHTMGTGEIFPAGTRFIIRGLKA